jgi:hypothetical protein
MTWEHILIFVLFFKISVHMDSLPCQSLWTLTYRIVCCRFTIFCFRLLVECLPILMFCLELLKRIAWPMYQQICSNPIQFCYFHNFEIYWKCIPINIRLIQRKGRYDIINETKISMCSHVIYLRNYFFLNHNGDVMVSVLVLSVADCGFKPGRVKPKTIKLQNNLFKTTSTANHS